MVKRAFWMMAVVGLLLVSSKSMAEIVKLDETPVAEFTLPDGSVLNNAFVWRRSSQGLMIVHDDGQFFLNYQTLPDDWKAVYLGEPEEEPEAEAVEEEQPLRLDDRYDLADVLRNVPGLTKDCLQWLLQEDADKEIELTGLSIALYHSLLNGRRESAKRFLLIIEERRLDDGAVQPEKLFNTCMICDGAGEYEQPCPDCSATGKCPECDGEGVSSSSLGSFEKTCPTCEGSAVCIQCEGARERVQPCRNCRGLGQLLDEAYCEVQRQRLLHDVMIMAEGIEDLPLTRQPDTHVPEVLETLSDLKPEVLTYLTSEKYDGSMDTNIVAACLLQSASKERGDLAARFNYLLEAEFPNNDVIDIEEYLVPCADCDMRGMIKVQCAYCGEKEGQCANCEGTGEALSQFRTKEQCSECKATGLCRYCGGNGILKKRCGTCEGRGRVFKEMRAEIKLQLLVGDINRYHRRILRTPVEDPSGTNVVENAE